MLIRTVTTTLLLCTAGGRIAPGDVIPIEVMLKPAKSGFLLGEPICMELSVKNNSAEPVRVTLSYPDHLGLSFACDDKSAIVHRGPMVESVRIPAVEIAAGTSYQAVLALDRYLSLTAPGRYTVEYRASYSEPFGRDAVKPREYRAKGQFVVDVQSGQPALAEMADRLRKDLGSSDPSKVQEAAELLLWVNDPSAIEPLDKAAAVEPNAIPDIVEALGKFVSTEKGRCALFRVAGQGEADAVRAAFAVCAKKKTPIPDDFYRSLLSSRNTGRRFAAAEHLVKQNDAQHRPLIESLAKDKNPAIANLARKSLGLPTTQPEPNQGCLRPKD